jgi:hypothetical protein
MQIISWSRLRYVHNRQHPLEDAVSFYTKMYKDLDRSGNRALVLPCVGRGGEAGDPCARACDTQTTEASHADSSARPFIATPRANRQVLPELQRPNAPGQHRAARELQESRSALIHLRVRREHRRFGDAHRLTDGGPRAFRP